MQYAPTANKRLKNGETNREKKGAPTIFVLRKEIKLERNAAQLV
jgi:hypothetical protein